MLPTPGTERIAHVDGSGKRSHLLGHHLNEVARMAALFASDAEAAEWARLAGLWHDLGKYGKDFQDYIRGASGYEAHLVDSAPGKVNHSSAGALYAVKSLPELPGRILAYLIAGHHAGLADWFGDEAGGRSLESRLQEDRDLGLLEHALAGGVPADLLNQACPKFGVPGGKDGLHLWIRLLFSSLVDADFLDTEAFMEADKADQRAGGQTSAQLLGRFDAAMEAKKRDAEDTPLNKIRAEVLQQCRMKAKEPGGIFTLTVPTGGGKTLSSLAFALEHARHHNKLRVIYAIPYTSIIEQTAQVFRDIFGDAVLEHHSNFDPDQETPKSRLAAENWDAPLVVTTNVQLFESLFAARTSRCRKLHNIVNSVIVLDEAQLLPPELLQPILDTMRLLAAHYGVTFVLCTATQPALNSVKDPFGKTIREGLEGCREIVDKPDSLFEKLRRVDIFVPNDLSQPTEWRALAAEVAQHEQVLVIVNSRGDCRRLHALMPEGTVHLSALMCGEHRSRVIASIRQKLGAKKPVRVISTQLIEAGVDIDFPVVYRALAGLDSIAQAAGRCNREGLQSNQGKVFVFVPPSRTMGLLKFGEQACRNVLYQNKTALLSPGRFREYFESFFAQLGAEGIDKYGIVGLLVKDARQGKIQFKTAAAKFQLIDDTSSVSVIVPYSNPDRERADSRPLIAQLRNKQVYRALTRRLQRYTVSLRRYEFDTMQRSGAFEEPLSGFIVLRNELAYDEAIGLLVNHVLSPEQLIC